MSDLPANPERHRIEPRQSDDLIIEAIDEQAILRARERMADRARLLWTKRRSLLWAAVCGLVVATLIAFLIPQSYTSTARLMPPNQGSGAGAGMLAALSSQVGSNLASLAQSALGTKSNGALFIGILQSQTVRDDLIHKFHLMQLYHEHYIEGARKELAKHSGISQDSKTGIITISVTDHDPRRAAAMTQEYINELNWVVTHLNTTSAHREVVFLNERLKQVKANMENAEKRFSQFASQKGAIDVPEQGKAMVEAAASLQGQLIAAESELDGYRQIYTNNNVRVRSLQARVDKLRSSLEKIAGKGTDENSSAQQIYPSLRELPLLGVTYADLLRKMKVEEAVFETLTEQDELAKVQEAKDTPSVKVLDPPLVPEEKSGPHRGMIMALGAMLSFVFGAAWILAGSAWEAVDSNDPRKILALEVWSDVHASLPWRSRNGSRNGKPKREDRK